MTCSVELSFMILFFANIESYAVGIGSCFVRNSSFLLFYESPG